MTTMNILRNILLVAPFLRVHGSVAEVSEMDDAVSSCTWAELGDSGDCEDLLQTCTPTTNCYLDVRTNDNDDGMIVCTITHPNIPENGSIGNVPTVCTCYKDHMCHDLSVLGATKATAKDDPCRVLPDDPWDSYHYYYPYRSDEDCLEDHKDIACTGCCEFQVEFNTNDVWELFSGSGISADDDYVCHVTAQGGDCHCRGSDETACLVLSSMDPGGTCSNTELSRDFNNLKSSISSGRIGTLWMVWMLAVYYAGVANIGYY